VSGARRIVFWRHGRTDWNAAGRFQGQSDVMLDEVGVAQAAAAAEHLAQLEPSVILSSDLVRAVATARPLADATGLPIVQDEGLRETFVGVWEGMHRADIEREHTDDLQQWIAGTNVRPGLHGETRTEVATRVRAAVDRGLDLTAPGQTLVCVTHGAAAMSGIAALLDLPLEHWPVFSVMPNCSWSIVVESESYVRAPWRLQEYGVRAPAR
jgi:broad specificity phosphatase PhoE